MKREWEGGVAHDSDKLDVVGLTDPKGERPRPLSEASS